MKKSRKMEKQKKGRHLEKHQNEFFFHKSNRVKRRGDTELECKTGVKHNSKSKNTFSKIKFYLLEKKDVNKGIEKKSGYFNTKVFLFCSKKLKNTKREMRKETPKKEREHTKQFEPDGKWNKKNMFEKKTRGKSKKRREQSEKKKKRDEQMKKNAKKKTKNQSR